MTYAPTTYTEAEAQLNEVTAEVAGVLASVRTAIARISAANVKMTGLAQTAPIGYLDLITYIAGQDQNDAAWADMKRRSDKIVADFGSVQGYIQGLIAAIDGV
jgi:hypothetical protein